MHSDAGAGASGGSASDVDGGVDLRGGSVFDQGEGVADFGLVALDVLHGEDGAVVDGQLGEAELLVVEDVGDGEDLEAAELGVRLCALLANNTSVFRNQLADVPSHAVDNVGDGDTGVGSVGAVVDDGVDVNGTVGTKRPQTFVPVDVARDIQIDTIVKEESLKSITHGLLVAGDSGRPHGTVGTGNDPGGLGAVDSGKISLHPLVLLVGLVVEGVVTPTLDVTEWASVIGEGLGRNGSGILAVGVGEEVGLGAVGVVRLTIEGDEVDWAIVETVPKISLWPLSLISSTVE